MFIDEACIEVRAGKGGNGCHSYERQPYKPKGRPDGGDGGRGGHVFIVGSSQKHTLQDMTAKQHIHAGNGMHGKGSQKTGKSGTDVTITVPLGTMVWDAGSDRLILDCVKTGIPFCIARGGRGGRGNASLVTRRNRNPASARPGAPGEEKKLTLVLKVLADVGLVGRPNAGKSTFLSRVSRARPKIADYPFTTTEPHLGIVQGGSRYSPFVMADIPGLIENSHQGKGLGIRFLRHIERTRVLAFLIDATTPDPLREAEMLKHELLQYSPCLGEKPSCCILTKTDLVPEKPDQDTPGGWFRMSAVTGDGVAQVIHELTRLVHESRGQ
ncbi:MAG: GTPase ObgE [Chitinispirillaceae bacterium]|nr:GTPase ObgE [Chitinispirillaceae bacterium]